MRVPALSRIRSALPPPLSGPMAMRSGAGLALKVFGLASAFAFAAGSARLLGPSGYGQVAVAFSVTGIATMFALAGISGLAVREIAAFNVRQAWPELWGFTRWALALGLGLSIIAALGIALFSPFWEPYSLELRLAAIGIPLFTLADILRGLNQGAGRVVRGQFPAHVIRWVLALSLMGLLFFSGVQASTVDVMVIVLVSSAAALAVGGLTFRGYIVTIPRAKPKVRGRIWMVAASPFLAITLFGIVGTEINTVLLGLLAGPREAGLYQPIARLAPLMLIGVQAIADPLAPQIVLKWEQEDRQGLARLLHRSTIAGTIVTAAAAGAIVILSPYILAAFGPEFLAYGPYLVWIAAAQVLNTALGPSALLLAMLGNMRDRLAAQSVTLIIQAGLGFILIPQMGAGGAVFALVVAIIIWAVLHWLVALRTIGIDTSIVGALRAARTGQYRA